jgi:hypothetical protein
MSSIPLVANRDYSVTCDSETYPYLIDNGASMNPLYQNVTFSFNCGLFKYGSSVFFALYKDDTLIFLTSQAYSRDYSNPKYFAFSFSNDAIFFEDAWSNDVPGAPTTHATTAQNFTLLNRAASWLGVETYQPAGSTDYIFRVCSHA